MWIRSQDKEILTNCTTLYIDKEDSNYIIEGNIGSLGTYSTKEKALKVLDEIQKFCNLVEEFKSQGARFGVLNSSERLINFTFQMPQDDEV